MTDDGVADRRLVGNLVLERVGLGGTDERDFHDLTVGINQRNGGTDGDGQITRGGSNLSVGEDGLDLGNTSGVLGLLVLGGIVLGVLRKVAERAGFLDVLDDLLGVIALTPSELLDELLAALSGQYDLACVHTDISPTLIKQSTVNKTKKTG